MHNILFYTICIDNLLFNGEKESCLCFFFVDTPFPAWEACGFLATTDPFLPHF